MSGISVRLSETDFLRIEQIKKATGSIYNSSDVIGAAITMINNHGFSRENENSDVRKKLKDVNAEYLFSVCVNPGSSTLIRDVSIENSCVHCIFLKGAVVRTVPPNILEFGSSDKFLSRIFIYPGTKFYNSAGIEIKLETIKPGTEKIKIVLIEDSR